MPIVTVEVPGLLTRFTDGAKAVSVEAQTMDDAVTALLTKHPDLHPHLFSHTGELRTHLKLLLNGRVLEYDSDTDMALEPGDEVVFVQAVSGG